MSVFSLFSAQSVIVLVAALLLLCLYVGEGGAHLEALYSCHRNCVHSEIIKNATNPFSAIRDTDPFIFSVRSFPLTQDFNGSKNYIINVLYS